MRSLPAARSAGPPSAPPPQGPGQYLLPLQVQHLLGEGRLRSLYLLQPLEKNRDRGHDGENKRQPGLLPRPSAQGTPPYVGRLAPRGSPSHPGVALEAEILHLYGCVGCDSCVGHGCTRVCVFLRAAWACMPRRARVHRGGGRVRRGGLRRRPADSSECGRPQLWASGTPRLGAERHGGALPSARLVASSP